MDGINSWVMYYVSFFPLWIAIIFLDIKNIIIEEENLYTEIISIVLITSIFIFCCIMLREMIKNKSNLQKYNVIKAKKAKDITIEYFLAYVLPLFAFDFTQWDGMVTFLIFFLFLGTLCTRHSYFTANVLLEIFKYDYYECTLKVGDNVEVDSYVISSRKLKGGDEIYLRKLNDDYKIEPKL